MRVLTGWLRSSTASRTLGFSDGFKAVVLFLVMSGVLESGLAQLEAALGLRFPDYAAFFTSAGGSLLLLARLYVNGAINPAGSAGK